MQFDRTPQRAKFGLPPTVAALLPRHATYRSPFSVRSSLLTLSILLSGCASSHHREHDEASAQGPRILLYSPNGEPLNGGALGRPTCEAALSRWFDRVDTDHDGVISREEFAADASAQFARMDIDHNGYLLSEELDRYRLPYRQVPMAGRYPPASTGAAATDGETRHRHRRTTSDEGGTARENDSSAQADLADPVMSADTNNDFKVTQQEFSAHAERTFFVLDANHDGRLSHDELVKFCARYAKSR